MKVEADFDVNRQFQRSLALFMQSTRKEIRVVMWDQSKAITKNMFGVTPPMGGKKATFRPTPPGKKSAGVRVDFAKGLAAITQNMDADLSRALWPFDQRGQTALDMALLRQYKNQGEKSTAQWKSWWKSNQRKDKSMPRIKQLIPQNQFNELKKWLYSKRGITASGWSAAVGRFGITGIPKWITRHSGTIGGSADFHVDENLYWFEITNDTPHTASRAIQSMVNQGIGAQAARLEAQARNWAEKTGNTLLG